MARQQTNPRLQTVEARRALPERHEPYWHEVRRGLHLGYRKGSAADVWWVREWRNGRYWKRRLGLADSPDVARDGVAVLSWADALKATLGEDRPTATALEKYTLEDALEEYWRHRQAKSPGSSVATDRAKAEASIPEKLLQTDLASLSAAALRSWRDGLVPPTEDREAKRRGQATANRTWSILRAALNLAFDNGRTGEPERWRRIKPFRNVDRARTRALTHAEATRLLHRVDPDFRQLARGALYTGLRLGELLELRVADVGDDEVRVLHSKSGKARVVPLNGDGKKFFEQVTAGRDGAERVFTKANGKAWHRMDASRLMAKASAEAKLSPAARFHDLRRSYATVLLNAGTDAEIIQELLGHADLRMTRRAYAHLLNATVRKAVEKKLPSFGLEPSNIRKLR